MEVGFQKLTAIDAGGCGIRRVQGMLAVGNTVCCVDVPVACTPVLYTTISCTSVTPWTYSLCALVACIALDI
jgi:hypothetical protein